MNDILKKAQSLCNALSDDPNDYPDMSMYRMIQDKVKELQEACKAKEPTEVLVYVEGGIVQGCNATDDGVPIAIEVFDVDNKKDEGEMSRDEIEEEWKELSKDTRAIY